MRCLITFLFVISVAVGVISQKVTGDNCESLSGPGICEPINKCESAIEDLRFGILPEHCGFEGRLPIVCCHKIEKIVDISEKRCKDYSLIVLNNRDGLIQELAGGVQSLAQEFPHMAALGFDDGINRFWLCGGTLISEQFILTAAHCLNSRELGPVRWVRVGDLNLNSTFDDAMPQEFRVIQSFRHPDYKPPSKYNDIALLKLDRPVEFNSYVLPACLYNHEEITTNYLTATGWGSQEAGGESSEHLMKVDLEFYTSEECRSIYKPDKTLLQGFDNRTQICAGGRTKIKDTCKGDSGGPLQIVSEYASNLYRVVGITSFGKICGNVNIPGVYIKVSSYVPWIESIVWPTNTNVIRF